MGPDNRGSTVHVLQWQKFQTDDIIKCLHNRSKYSYFCRAPNVNLFDFLFLLVDYGKVLCSSANKLQQTRMPLLRRIYLQEYWLFCSRFITFTFDLYGLLSFVFVNNSKNNITTMSANQSSWLGSGLILPHQYQISVAKVQTPSLWNVLISSERGETLYNCRLS